MVADRNAFPTANPEPRHTGAAAGRYWLWIGASMTVSRNGWLDPSKPLREGDSMGKSDQNPAPGSTTGAGAPAPSDRNSLTVGANGPLVLHDVHFLEQMAHFNREKVTGAPAACQGQRRLRRVRDHRGRLAPTPGGAVPAGREDRDAGALFHRGRRTGQPRHLARRARLLAEVLHERRQLRPGRQQHARLLRARPDEVPALHPQPEAPAGLGPARQPHAVGLLDEQSRVARTRSPISWASAACRAPGAT